MTRSLVVGSGVAAGSGRPVVTVEDGRRVVFLTPIEAREAAVALLHCASAAEDQAATFAADPLPYLEPQGRA